MSDQAAGIPSRADAKPLKAYWGSDPSLPLQFVDNLHLQILNDQVYLTFGQIRVGVAAQEVEGSEPPTAEIKPIARLVLTQEGLARVARLFAQYAPQTKE